ncbi:MAG: phage holin family protein [Armatimonadota bacterium]
MEEKQSLSELLTKSLRAAVAYLKAEALVFVRKIGKKAGLFAGAVACLILALVYLSIGIVRLLAHLMGSEIAPFFLMTAILLVVCAILFGLATLKEDKDDKKTKVSKDAGT